MINRKRMHSRSNQALKVMISELQQQKPIKTHSAIQNIQETQTKDQELFQQSFNKIQKLKVILGQSASKQLMQQLNDVIDLIKGQRVKAKITIQDLQAQFHKNKNQNNDKSKLQDIGINTDQLLQMGMEESKQTASTQVQTQEQQIQNNSRHEQIKIRQKKFETYYKLICMIDKLKVDYRKILPIMRNLPQKYILPNVDQKIAEYKVLKPQQIIKFQKVFMKKLNTMLNSQINSRKQKVQQQNNKNVIQNNSNLVNSLSVKQHQNGNLQKQQDNKLQNNCSKQKLQLQYKSRCDKKPVFYQLTRKRIM